METQLHTIASALAHRYHFERELGRGGMATVYLAEDLKHHRRVAIKVLKPELRAALGAERFLREIETAARLHHPHILPLYDSGDADGILYYVMPYVEGESLRDRLDREKQLSLDDALEITREVADALSYAHSHGVIHRDMKPENILLESGHAAVADFGIARAISAAGGEQLTETSVAIGTSAYMSPEQSSASRDLDGRSDLYSLGCVLYEMLAGKPPFTGPTAESVMRQHLIVEPPDIVQLRPTVPAPVAAALSRALAKTPADRFHTASAFATALSTPASPVTQRVTPGDSRRRTIRWLALAGAAAAIVAVGALLVVSGGRRAAAPTGPTFERTAIAVLPFQNLSAEPSHAYFAAGLHDEVLTQLANVAALKVISRTSVMGYAAPNTPPVSEIATALTVGTIVEGSVQVVGNRLRVNVQLIDASTDAHLWAERFDRTLDDAFAIQSEIARQIVAGVGAALAPAEEARLASAPTRNPEAYRLYLQGRDYAGRPGRVRQNFEAAQELFERAVALDPEFALARAALSEVYGRSYWFRYDPTPLRARRQREEAEAALRLAPDLPQAHVAMGLTHYFGRRDFRQALDELTTALEALPNDAEVWWWWSMVQRRLRNWSEHLRGLARVSQLNPRESRVFLESGGTYGLLHRYSDAIRAYEQALRLAPDLHEAAVMRATVFARWRGQVDTLRAVLSRMEPNADLGGWGTADGQRFLLLHWNREADSILQLASTTRMAVLQGVQFFRPVALHAAWAHRSLGDRSAAAATFTSALGLIDSVMHELPDDHRLHASRGLALAGLRQRDLALAEARWLSASVIYREDPVLGPVLAEDRAKILAQIGEAEEALDEIERLLAEPSWLGVGTLRLDPLWDPIREHPRFRALLAKQRPS